MPANDMTPTELRAVLHTLHWSQRGLADVLQRAEGTVRQWARGALPVPPEVATWLRRLTHHANANPPPARTTRAD